MKRNRALTELVDSESGDAFLVMSIRDAIAREVADFMDLVPSRKDAVMLLMDAIDMGIDQHKRKKSYWQLDLLAAI